LTTTVPRAKELRPFVERIITIAKRGLAAAEPNGRTLLRSRHRRRQMFVTQQGRGLIAEHRDAVLRDSSQLAMCDSMSHRL
jgi:hypothetical protein